MVVEEEEEGFIGLFVTWFLFRLDALEVNDGELAAGGAPDEIGTSGAPRTPLIGLPTIPVPGLNPGRDGSRA